MHMCIWLAGQPKLPSLSMAAGWPDRMDQPRHARVRNWTVPCKHAYCMYNDVATIKSMLQCIYLIGMSTSNCTLCLSSVSAEPAVSTEAIY